MSEEPGRPEDVKPPASPQQPPASSAGGGDEKTLAMLAHLLGIVTGFVAALIIYLIATDKPIAKRHAQEALNFQITIAIAWIASWVLAFIGIGFLLMPLVWIFNLVFCIIAGMAANRGEDYRYPVAIRLVK